MKILAYVNTTTRRITKAELYDESSNQSVTDGAMADHQGYIVAVSDIKDLDNNTVPVTTFFNNFSCFEYSNGLKQISGTTLDDRALNTLDMTTPMSFLRATGVNNFAAL